MRLTDRPFANPRFCPRCGCEALHRDIHEYQDGPYGQHHSKPSFNCLMCGFSFILGPSVRWMIAQRLFREHREVRTPGS